MGTIVLGLGIWQSVVVLVAGNLYGSFLFVVLTLIYSFFVFWQTLHTKGLKVVYHMEHNAVMIDVLTQALFELRQQVQALVPVAEEDEEEKGTSGAARAATAPLIITGPDRTLKGAQRTGHQLTHDAIVQLSVVVVSWVAAFLIVNV